MLYHVMPYTFSMGLCLQSMQKLMTDCIRDILEDDEEVFISPILYNQWLQSMWFNCLNDMLAYTIPKMLMFTNIIHFQDDLPYLLKNKTRIFFIHSLQVRPHLVIAHQVKYGLCSNFTENLRLERGFLYLQYHCILGVNPAHALGIWLSSGSDLHCTRFLGYFNLIIQFTHADYIHL